ncbi:hypothetical protein BDV30DRAFT_235869 [Aspergillus minisclerotigenes]|uniref:Uncharacterized protein n=1 Tax=Aspergillus minisclerotigenes TaxID=656917 RepID=A0A5N6JDP1_9EURO|nr:hypothetical protein BDV30DRAFT_235869 [Aspergillus minisclerotigenes]
MAGKGPRGNEYVSDGKHPMSYHEASKTKHEHTGASSGLRPKPLAKLDKVVQDFFGDGPDAASVKFESLQRSVMIGQTRIQRAGLIPVSMRPLIGRLIPWSPCKLAATLVLLIASPPEPDSMFEALKFLFKSLAAIDGKFGKVTMLGVSLVDVEMLERGEKKSRDMNY